MDYNIGYDANNQVIGCLSKSMIDKEQAQTLYHGVDILKDYIESFEVTNKPIYSFQDLQKLCTKHTDFELFLENFVEIIVFDAIVGNTDRHTENWAFITDNTKEKISFSPIYDSGSCLGREIAERKIEDYLKNPDKIIQYIDKGMSEIRWNDSHLNLFETAQKAVNEFPDISKKILKKIKDFEKTKSIKNIVNQIDTNLISNGL